MGMSQLALTELLRPFVQCLASKTGEPRLRGTITNTVFTGLIKQSDEGIEHQEKLEAWQRVSLSLFCKKKKCVKISMLKVTRYLYFTL
jgi:hypothetical protein